MLFSFQIYVQLPHMTVLRNWYIYPSFFFSYFYNKILLLFDVENVFTSNENKIIKKKKIIFSSIRYSLKQLKSSLKTLN